MDGAVVPALLIMCYIWSGVAPVAGLEWLVVESDEMAKFGSSSRRRGTMGTGSAWIHRPSICAQPLSEQVFAIFVGECRSGKDRSLRVFPVR